MAEFVSTGQGMKLVETNNASGVPFTQGALIIEDSGNAYYDPTTGSTISDRILVGSGIKVITDVDKATKPGIYAIEVEEMALHAKYRQILLVSDYIDEAGMEYCSVFQTLFDAQQGKVKTRKQSYNKEQLKYEWTAWETVGEVDLGNYYTKTEIDSKVSSVYKYKGTVPSAMLLPDSKEVGDVYNTVFEGYVPSHTEHNYILTGISYEGSLTVDTEITLTFENNVLGQISFIPIDGCDIAFWFDSTYFFIGKVVSASTNSYVVKVADLDIKDTEYGHNPCFVGIDYCKEGFSNGHITSLTLQSVNYWQNVGSGIKYEYIPKGGNVAWTGSSWDSLGTTVDTSNFATKNELSNKVNVSDYADYDKFGIVKITSGDGIGIIDGAIYTKIADGSLILGRSGSQVHEVITPSNLNLAVKSALSDDKRINDMTDQEKENARGVIGAIGSTELNNYYTKTEIDSKVSSVYKYKGTVPSPMLLPDTNDIGDVYNTIFAGYVPIYRENNYTLTGISYEGNLTTDTEITLTFANDVVTDFYSPVDGTDIAFWFDSNYFFIGEIISHSNNSYVVKMANLDTKDTMYFQNPCIDNISRYKNKFSSGSITSVTLESLYYWQSISDGGRFEYIPKGGNVAYTGRDYTGSEWDSLGSTVDTSNFATKKYVDDAVSSSGGSTVIDSELSNTSTNAVQNKVIKQAIDLKAEQLELERLKYYGDPDIVPSDESYFTVNETGETITGLTDAGKTQTELIIPYKINGKLITGLYNDRENISILDGNTIITKVIIPNSVTNIGGSAFSDCTSLTSINIPDGINSIGILAFNGCTSLKSINIPNSVRYIDTSAFRDCTSLKEINIPNSVTGIDIYAFAGCTSLTSINIPNNVTNIGDNAFNGCTNLKIYCEQGSYAETYAKTNNIPIVYTDVKDIVSSTNVLTKTNTTEFTPSSDYQPATKKYVDDAINASSSGEALNVSTVKSCTGDELLAIISPTMGSIRYVSTAGTGDNTSITPGLYFYLDSWKKVAFEDTAIISNEFVSGGDSTSINN